MKDKLPPCGLYAKYLQIASFRFRLRIEDCRKRFGLFTLGQWHELLGVEN